MKQRLAILIVLTVISPVCSWGADTSACEAMAKRFLDLMATGKTVEAVDYLYHTNPWSEKVPDTIQQMKGALGSTLPVLGDYRGSTLVSKQVMGDRLVYLYYLVSYDRQPLKFEFYFHKPGDKWVIQYFAFSDKVLEVLPESAWVFPGATGVASRS